jgi:quinol---cytochrome c reductase iron-sulfur subunit, bacillus type
MEEGTEKDGGMTRRELLLSAVNVAILSVMGMFLAVPVIELFLSHVRREDEATSFFPVARLSELVPGKPVQKAVIATQRDAWTRTENVNKGSVWLVKDGAGEIKAYSSICPHLGCIYGWNVRDGIFVCPCHVSGFSLDGQVLKGPSPRRLDELETRIQGEEVLVRYQKFIAGIPQKKAI